jgi:hypothetical protein
VIEEVAENYSKRDICITVGKKKKHFELFLPKSHPDIETQLRV